MTRKFGILVFAGLTCGMGISPVLAGDVEMQGGCDLSGAVWGSYSYTQAEVDGFSGSEQDFHGPFGTGAALLACGNWNIQLDGSASAAFWQDSGTDGQSLGFGAESKLFWRDPAMGAAGAFASYDFQHFESDEPGDLSHVDTDSFGVGLFAQYYAGDSLTLGLSGGLSWDDASDKSGPGSFDAGEYDNWFVAGAAKFYGSPQWAFVLNGRYDRSELWDGVASSDSYSFGGGAEYLLENSGVSLFAGGGAFFQDVFFEGDEGPGLNVDISGFNVFAGLRYDFGPVDSLVERDRTGPLNLSLLP